jgi:hypothetical protein
MYFCEKFSQKVPKILQKLFAEGKCFLHEKARFLQQFFVEIRKLEQFFVNLI